VRDKCDGKLWGLKTVSKNFASKWRFELIRREYEIMREACHPFIVKMFGSFTDQKNYNFIIEYCPGGNLFELLRKLKRLPSKMALYYFCEMLLAVQYLHRKNIIFRDIKAENILLDANGHLKLTDFGLAKQLDSRDEAVNSFCGSPIYIAPETLRKEKYNRKVDFYALGILLYEMVTGVPPFLNKDPNILKNMKLQGAVHYPSSMHPKVRTMIEACLHGVASADQNPDKRIADFNFYFGILQELGVSTVEVLGKADALIYDQKLYKNPPRKTEETPVIANSTVKEISDPLTKNNYEELEKIIGLNRLKAQAKTAQQFFGRYSKRDFNFGRFELPKVDPVRESAIDLSAAKSSISKSIFH